MKAQHTRARFVPGVGIVHRRPELDRDRDRDVDDEETVEEQLELDPYAAEVAWVPRTRKEPDR